MCIKYIILLILMKICGDKELLFTCTNDFLLFSHEFNCTTELLYI